MNEAMAHVGPQCHKKKKKNYSSINTASLPMMTHNFSIMVLFKTNYIPDFTIFTSLTYFTLFLCHFPQLPLDTLTSSQTSLTNLPCLYQLITLIYALHTHPLSTTLNFPACSIFSTTHCLCNIPVFTKQLSVFGLEGPWNSER